jgi:hypothetical protein
MNSKHRYLVCRHEVNQDFYVKIWHSVHFMRYVEITASFAAHPPPERGVAALRRNPPPLLSCREKIITFSPALSLIGCPRSVVRAPDFALLRSAPGSLRPRCRVRFGAECRSGSALKSCARLIRHRDPPVRRPRCRAVPGIYFGWCQCRIADFRPRCRSRLGNPGRTLLCALALVRIA